MSENKKSNLDTCYCIAEIQGASQEAQENQRFISSSTKRIVKRKKKGAIQRTVCGESLW